MSSFLLCHNCWKGQTKISKGCIWSQNKKCCWTTGSSRTSAHSELLNTCQKSVFLFLLSPEDLFFVLQHQKKGCFANSKWASFGSNKKNVWSLWKSCLSLKQESESKYFIFCCELPKYELFALFEIKKAMEIRS